MNTHSAPLLPPGHLVRNSRGFALIVTLLLMILLTVIAVGLLSLSTISLRSSDNQRAMTVARANARMALMLAIGQLQKATGPDQRVTATADLAGAADGERLDAGEIPVNLANQGSSVLPGTRYWTGVWKNSQAAPTLTQIYTQPPSSTFVQWLISGNEHENEASLAAPTLKPSQTDYQVGSNGAASDPTKAVVLAGTHSVGASADSYVSAPIVAVSDSGQRTGGYAWWIGDEGVKSKINRASSYSGAAPATYANLSAQRAGWEAVDGFSSFPAPGDPNHASLSKMPTLASAALVDSSVTSGTGVSPLNRVFHSATTDSMGVIADSMQGGLRLDLTAYLDAALPPAGTVVTGLPNAPAADTNIIPAGSWVNTTPTGPALKGPTWDRLKAFNDLGKNLTNGKLLTKEAANVNEAAIAPVIVDLRLLLGVKLEDNPPPAVAGTSCKIRACAKVAVTLANPYPYPLEWTQALDLEILNSFLNVTPNITTAPAANQALCRIYITTVNSAGKDVSAPSAAIYVPNSTAESAVFNKTIFRIPAQTLQPGEVIAFTNAGAVTTPGDGAVVPMDSFADTDPDIFDNCVMLQSTVTKALTPPFRLDVREQTCTTPVDVELRHQGSAGPLLRKIERFELDNHNYADTQRRFGTADDSSTTPKTVKASDYPRPIPLQLYKFQMSQPGVDYREKFVNKADFGLRSSTLRSYTDFNWQATRYRKPLISYNPPPFFMALANSADSFETEKPGGFTGGAFIADLTIDPLRWGRADTEGATKTVLFSPPRQLISMAQFQHADLTADDHYASVAHQPGNAFGNSYASPFVSRNTVSDLARRDYIILGDTTWPLPRTGYSQSSTTGYYDISYLLNTALWDSYFLSTLPRSGPKIPLNEQMVKLNPADDSAELLSGKLAASRLLINGAFNVNSTNRDAWIGLLASSRHLKHSGDPASSSTDAMFPRSLEQISGSVSPPTGIENDSFSGYRRLTNQELGLLADEIVKQVRLRGPFLSLAHFVNRTLAPMDTPLNKQLGRSGPLQSAIDASGATVSPDGTKNPFVDVDLADDTLNLGDGGIKADLSGSFAATFGSPYPAQSADGNPGAIAGILADASMMTTDREEQGFRSTGIPGWLTQADVLQVIGSSLSARSDTFRIRAYGEAVNPRTGTVTARAWCEAVVQRTPDYIDPIDPPETRAADLQSAVNRTFGRRYELVSYRWLSPDEI